MFLPGSRRVDENVLYLSKWRYFFSASQGAHLSVLAVKPAGRPELNPSAVDKTAVLEVLDDVGNSGAAEACTPSAACDSFFIRRPFFQA